MKKNVLLVFLGLWVSLSGYGAEKPNILVICGDDIGSMNISAYNDGLMGYRTPNIGRIAASGSRFTDHYGEQSCTTVRSAFVTGQHPVNNGLTRVGIPGSSLGLQPENTTLATFKEFPQRQLLARYDLSEIVDMAIKGGK